MHDTQEEVVILLVEDDPGHASLIKKNMRRSNINNDIILFEDGQKAIDFFTADPECPEKKRPSSVLILLDLNLPVVNGYEVLQWLKSNEDTKNIPVIVLTTTDDPREVDRCYDLGCNVYIRKPVEYDKFTEAIRKLGMFLTIVIIPDGEQDVRIKTVTDTIHGR